MSFQEISISRIKPNPQNARTHSPKQIRQIADSIIALGFRNPLLVNEHDELIAGHGRFKAAELLGLKTVPVIVVAGLSPAKQRALAIADNKIAENTGWDRDRLAIEIPELAELLAAEGLDISLLGFAPIEIARLETEFEPAASSRNGMVPDGIDPRWGEAPVVSKTGDLWLLGDHALLCGDACSADDLLRLMSGRRADAAFLDPRGAMTWPAGTTVAGVLTRALRAAAGVTRDGGVHFVCTDWQHLAALMAAAQPVYGGPVDGAVWVNSDMQSGALLPRTGAHRHLCRRRQPATRQSGPQQAFALQRVALPRHHVAQQRPRAAGAARRQTGRADRRCRQGHDASGRHCPRHLRRHRNYDSRGPAGATACPCTRSRTAAGRHRHSPLAGAHPGECRACRERSELR